MSKYFVPYNGDRPVAVSINGHRLLILCRDKGVLENDLNLIGADRIKPLRGGKSRVAEEKALSKFAKKHEAGVVLAPESIELSEILHNLHTQLPWLQ